MNLSGSFRSRGFTKSSTSKAPSTLFCSQFISVSSRNGLWEAHTGAALRPGVIQDTQIKAQPCYHFAGLPTKQWMGRRASDLNAVHLGALLQHVKQRVFPNQCDQLR